MTIVSAKRAANSLRCAANATVSRPGLALALTHRHALAENGSYPPRGKPGDGHRPRQHGTTGLFAWSNKFNTDCSSGE